MVAATGTWLLYRISRNLTTAARSHGFRLGQIGSASMVSLARVRARLAAGGWPLATAERIVPSEPSG